MSEYFRKWRRHSKRASTWQRHAGQLEHPDRRWLYEHVAEPVLDVACGSAVDAGGFEDYVGLDVTAPFLEAARFTYGVDNLVLGDGRSLPFRDGCFATAYAKDLLLHLEWGDALKVLGELVRVGRRSYVAWGVERDGSVYTPLPDRDVLKMRSGFWYNRFSRQRLNTYFSIGEVVEDTTITEVNGK